MLYGLFSSQYIAHAHVYFLEHHILLSCSDCGDVAGTELLNQRQRRIMFYRKFLKSNGTRAFDKTLLNFVHIFLFCCCPLSSCGCRSFHENVYFSPIGRKRKKFTQKVSALMTEFMRITREYCARHSWSITYAHDLYSVGSRLNFLLCHFSFAAKLNGSRLSSF